MSNFALIVVCLVLGIALRASGRLADGAHQTLNAIISDNPAERMNAFRNGWMGSGQYSIRGGGDSYGFFASGGVTNAMCAPFSFCSR